MNLSKLTNPVNPEHDMPSHRESEPAPKPAPLPEDHELTGTATPTTDDSRTISNTIATETPADYEVGADEEAYNRREENYGTEEGNYGEQSSVKERSTSEYRTLYYYLLDKYKSANHVSKVLDEFELYLKKLFKYQQLRNNMLIDTLKFLDERESFVSVNNLTHVEIQKKLNHITHNNEKISPLLSKLIELEKAENDEDSRANLNAFHNLIGINDSLSSDLVIQENNVFSDLYTNKYDFFELVKKNQCFENKISTMLDLQAQVQKDSLVEHQNVETGVNKVTKKRSKQLAEDGEPLKTNPKKKRKKAETKDVEDVKEINEFREVGEVEEVQEVKEKHVETLPAVV